MKPEKSGISVSGRGEVSAPPDLATVELGVSVLGSSVTEAASDAATAANAAIGALESSGLSRSDITTANYSITPEYDWHDNTRRLLGYRVSNTVRAYVRDLSKVGQILDAVATAAGDSAIVNSLSFSIEDDSDLIARAREAAWTDARTKAEHLARLAGREIGAATRIVEGGFGPPSPFPVARLKMAAAEDMATPIEAGSSSVTVDLRVRFALS